MHFHIANIQCDGVSNQIICASELSPSDFFRDTEIKLFPGRTSLYWILGILVLLTLLLVFKPHLAHEQSYICMSSLFICSSPHSISASDSLCLIQPLCSHLHFLVWCVIHQQHSNSRLDLFQRHLLRIYTFITLIASQLLSLCCARWYKCRRTAGANTVCKLSRNISYDMFTHQVKPKEKHEDICKGAGVLEKQLLIRVRKGNPSFT